MTSQQVGAVLSGVRVLDLSTYVAGPYCARTLGDYGADVVKLEPPGGEPGRGLEPFLDDEPGPERSGFFAFLNWNKRGITLDLESAKGQALLRDLVRHFDIVIESFAPGYLDERGIGFDALEAIRPGLIMTSITPYGQTGPWAHRAGNDLTADAISGWADVNANPGMPPLKTAGYSASLLAGTNAVIATLAALSYRDRHGIGQQVDVSVLEAYAVIAAQSFYLGQTDPPSVWRQRHTDLLAAKDGFVNLSVGLTHFYSQAWVELGLDNVDWAEQKYAEGRPGRAELFAMIAEKVAGREKRELFDKLAEMQVPVAMLMTPADLFADEHLRQRDFWVELDQPGIGRVTMPGPSFRLSATPASVRRPAPRVGEHTAEVLEELLGTRAVDVAELADARVIE